MRKKIACFETAMSVIANDAEECVIAEKHPQSPQPDELVSCIGGMFYGLKGEKWPTTEDGEPLFPWLQVVCIEVPMHFSPFYQKKLVCFYLKQENSDWNLVSSTDKSDFVVREYSIDSELVPIERPNSLKGHPFHRITWHKKTDYPSLDRYADLFDDAIFDAISKLKDFEFANLYEIKIGGWPTPIQGDQQYPGIFDMQIDMTENYMYLDSGIGYLGYSGGEWDVLFECF